MWPCVTAIINTYERPKLLERALASVLRQTYQDFEVIIIHDGPAGKATEKLAEAYTEKFEARDVTCRFMSLEENSGYQCQPKNVATWYAQGDYIAYLDDDNEWTDDHLEVLVTAIQEDVGGWPDFVYGRREYIDEREDKTPEVYTGESPFIPFDQTAAKRLANGPMLNFIDTSDALITKGALWRLQMATDMMWNEGYRRFGDWELFARAVHFAGWRGKAVDRIVQRYYWHGENLQLTRPIHESPKQQAV